MLVNLPGSRGDEAALREMGTDVVFVRLSDAEFHDSTYRENFGVKKIGDSYLVDRVEMDA